jgi:hypothetical protein
MGKTGKLLSVAAVLMLLIGCGGSSSDKNPPNGKLDTGVQGDSTPKPIRIHKQQLTYPKLLRNVKPTTIVLNQRVQNTPATVISNVS